MCGIVGVAGAAVLRRGFDTGLRQATDSLAHRGPDASGCWAAADAPLAFGHRRLAIIDLDEAATQPMVTIGPTPSALTFNGEIYNYADLREELGGQGVALTTQSDTEVLLQLCRTIGVEQTLRRIRGMFAFGFYDGAEHVLWLARDRFGEKPLYYTLQGATLSFASELRALRCLSSAETTIDDVAVDQLMRRSCIGGERSIYQDVHKLPAGTALRIPVSAEIRGDDIRRIVYWDPVTVAREAAAVPFTGSLDDAADELDTRLGASVMEATVSDVPLGAFLSGGVDSTSVVSQLTRRSNGVVKTFTIGFTNEYRSESDEARRIARHLGTHHTELTITSEELQNVIPRISDVYDEPFADSSGIPTYLVCELARREVTVALTGDGGDELFDGYPRYLLAGRALQMSRRIPTSARRFLARQLSGVAPERWDRLGAALGSVGPLRSRTGGARERAAKAVAILEADRLDEAYELLVTSFWNEQIVLGQAPSRTLQLPLGTSDAHRMMLHDTQGYLVDDILTKVDRAAMSVSLETRVPILSPPVFELAHSLPASLLVDGTNQKLVLKHLLARHVPRSLWDHPKRGFSIPIGAWLRGPVRAWANDLLSPQALAAHGRLDQDVVARIWREHLEGRRDWGSQLWNVLMFQAWYDRHHAPR